MSSRKIATAIATLSPATAIIALSAVSALAVATLPVLPAHADDQEVDRPVGHRQSVWTSENFASHRQKAMAFGDAYRTFLGRYKTEREVAAAAIAMASKQGFRDLLANPSGTRLRPGTKLYAAQHGKLVALIVVGKEPLRQGVHVVAAHTDSVRIDLKQRPIYGAGNAAWLQTHYYGGIKAYQWLSLPLELRGVVIDRNGRQIDIAIGDDANEPVLVIPDIAAHVSRFIDGKEGEEVPGEALDPILSSTPAIGTPAGRDPFTLQAERLLQQQYGVAPGDLVAAELELVPAGAARDVGIDRALVGGYGQDDRACVYAGLRALLSVSAPRHTAVLMLVDREEVGSTGSTGARSNFLRRIVAELIAGTDDGTASEIAVDQALSASMIVSADVTGAVNPHYHKLYETGNAPFLGAGVVWQTGQTGAATLAYIRTLLDRNRITHQAARWRKSRRGSSSTSATVLSFFTQHGMRGLDVSIPILSMHAPFEVISKADLYEAYRAYRAFLAD